MNSLNSLIALHETNERLKEIHELKGNLPELLNQKQIELDDIVKNEQTNQSQLEMFNSKITSIQTTLTESKDKLDKYNDQIFNVTNTKEYEALILETDQLKELISNLNQELSDFNTKKDELENDIESNQEIKSNLTASIQERAKRRQVQLKRQGSEVNMRLLLQELQDRDKKDIERKHSPLKPAINSVIIDTSNLRPEGVVEEIKKNL